MTKKIIFFFFIITCLFFYKTVLSGYTPFPGDLLIAEYSPWKTYSYLGYNPGSFPNKAQYFDVLRQLYPWKTFVIDNIRHGIFPLWNPYNFSGAPHFANFQSAVLYPLNIVYFILPQILAWTLLVFLQPFLSLIFTFFYARKMGITQWGATLAGISYAFSAFATVWLEYNTIGHVILWLPLILLALEHLLTKKSIPWSIVFVFSVVSSLLAGHIQIFFYLLFFVSIYISFRLQSFKNRLPHLLYFIILLCVSLGVGSVQLLPGFELLSHAARSPHEYSFLIEKILIQPWQIIMLLIPDFFGNPATRSYWPQDTYVGKVTSIGIVGLIFVCIAVLRKRNNIVRFFLIAALLILVLVTRNPFTEFLYSFSIPLISSSSPTLMIFLFSFCLSMLSGFGFDSFQKEKMSIKTVCKAMIPIFAMFFLSGVFIFTAMGFVRLEMSTYTQLALKNLFYSCAIFVVAILTISFSLVKRKFLIFIFVLLLVIQTFELWRAFQKFNPFSPQETVFPNAKILTFLKSIGGVDRFWGYGAAGIEANFATQYNLFSPDGYDPLYPKWYGEFIQSSRDGKINTKFIRQTRSDAVVAQGSGEKDFISNTNRLKILNILGVKYILDRLENGSSEKTFPPDTFKKIFDESGWRIFENLNTAPRAFLVSDYKVYRDPEEFGKIFFSETFDPTKTILLEKDPFDHSKNQTNTTSQNTGNKAHIENYTPHKMRIKTISGQNNLLFLSDTYFSGWKAFVDGKETEILRAHYAFRAVTVPNGTHTIEFRYQPNTFKLGFIVSLTSIGILILVLVHVRKKGLV